MTEQTLTTRAAFAAVGEFVRRRAAVDLAHLVEDTRIIDGRVPRDASVWRDWIANFDPSAEVDDFHMPDSRDIEYEDAKSQLLSLSEAFGVMTEFIWTFAHRAAPADLSDLQSALEMQDNGEADAVAWRNWIHITAWVLHGNTLQRNSWSAAFSVALYVSLPVGVEAPASFAVVDPDTHEGGTDDAPAHWVHLPVGHGVRDIGPVLTPLLADLRALVETEHAIVDLVVWLDPVGDLVGVEIGPSSTESALPLLRDIWVEAEPHPERVKTLTDEIVVRSSIHSHSFSSNVASDRQDMLATAVHDASVASTGDVVEIELIPRAGKAGLVVTRPMLDDVAAAELGLRLVSKG